MLRHYLHSLLPPRNQLCEWCICMIKKRKSNGIKNFTFQPCRIKIIKYLTLFFQKYMFKNKTKERKLLTILSLRMNNNDFTSYKVTHMASDNFIYTYSIKSPTGTPGPALGSFALVHHGRKINTPVRLKSLGHHFLLSCVFSCGCVLVSVAVLPSASLSNAYQVLQRDQTYLCHSNYHSAFVLFFPARVRN